MTVTVCSSGQREVCSLYLCPICLRSLEKAEKESSSMISNRSFCASAQELELYYEASKQAGSQNSAGSSQGPTSRILDAVHLFTSKVTQSNLNHSFRYSNTSLLHP